MAAIFAATALIAQGTNTILITTLYPQNLEWTSEQFSQVSGMLGDPLSAIAALLGGYLADRYGQRKFIAIGYIGFALLALTFGMLEPYWTITWFATAYFVLAPAFLGMAAVSGFSLFMKLSWTTAAATNFTCYMALLNVGDAIGKGLLASQLHKLFDYPTSFCLLGIVTLVPLILLSGVNAGSVERARRENRETVHR